MKKNLHLVPGIDGGGIERVLERYISILEKMNLKGVDQVFIKHDIIDGLLTKKFKEKGFNVYTIKSKRKNIISFTLNFIRILKKEGPSSVHIHLNYASWYPLLISYFIGIKTRIIHSHQYYPNEKIITKIFNKIFSFIWIFATHKLACSNEAGRWMYGKSKFIILPNSMVINDFKFNTNFRKSIRNKFNLSDKFVVGHIGRYSLQKNQIFLLDVFNRLLKINQLNAHLFIIGHGEKEMEIKNYVEELKISKFVTFLKPRNDINKFYNAFDVFFLPSLFEGLGIVAVESQINGLTTVVSDILPKDLEVTQNLRKISLESSLEEWANALYLNTNIKRKTSYKYFLETKFNSINDYAKKLYEIYLNQPI